MLRGTVLAGWTVVDHTYVPVSKLEDCFSWTCSARSCFDSERIPGCFTDAWQIEEE